MGQFMSAYLIKAFNRIQMTQVNLILLLIASVWVVINTVASVGILFIILGTVMLIVITRI